MLMLDTWEQTGLFNPADPTQKKIEANAYAPGGRATFYYNRVPNPGRLDGLRGLGMFMPSLGTAVKLGLVGLGLYLGATKTKPGRKVVRKVRGLLPRRK